MIVIFFYLMMCIILEEFLWATADLSLEYIKWYNNTVLYTFTFCLKKCFQFHNTEHKITYATIKNSMHIYQSGFLIQLWYLCPFHAQFITSVERFGQLYFIFASVCLFVDKTSFILLCILLYICHPLAFCFLIIPQSMTKVA